MKNNYTSQPLSKLLFDNGFNGRFDYVWRDCPFTKKPKLVWVDWGNEEFPLATDLPAYDILWDICVRYAKEFFGEHLACFSCHTRQTACECEEDAQIGYTTDVHPHNILSLLQQGKKQEAEDYIWEHCLFNPKNK